MISFRGGYPPPPLRPDYFDVGPGVSVLFDVSARPSVVWEHIDGPLLYTRIGTIHWLTWWERLQMKFGFTNIYRLERKHSPPGLIDKWEARVRREMLERMFNPKGV